MRLILGAAAHKSHASRSLPTGNLTPMSVARGPDGCKINYLDFGKRDAEPVLMVQGLGADSRSWFMQRRPFGRKYRCLAPDNRGVGRSGRPEGPYDLEMMAEDLLAVLDDAGVESAHVMGASMGGILASILAVRNPERVRSLILACTACRHEPWRRELLEQWAGIARSQGMHAFAQQNLRWIVGPRSLRRFWPIMQIVGPIAFGCPQDSFVAQVEAILAADDSLRTELVNVRVPTLVIVGSQDILTPVADAEELAELIPGAGLSILPGAAHGFMVEQAGVYNTETLGFLDRVTAPTAARVSERSDHLHEAATAFSG